MRIKAVEEMKENLFFNLKIKWIWYCIENGFESKRGNFFQHFAEWFCSKIISDF